MKTGLLVFWSVVFLVSAGVSTVRAGAATKKDMPEMAQFGFAQVVKGLKPRHDYVICINGYGGHGSNDFFARVGKIWRPTGEGYWDMQRVMSDSNGNVDIGINCALPAGLYRLKVLLKDPARRWRVVWNEDDIKFKIER